jgi:prepilin peptidase CpaA
MGGVFLSILLVALALILVSAGIEDIRTRTIANWKNAAIALLAPAWWWANAMTWSAVGWQVGIALGVLAFFAGAFALGQMGGGDVKLIAALALWLPLQPLIWMLLVMAVAGGALTLTMVAAKHLRRSAKPIEIPYGVAIVFAAFLTLGEPIINQLQ